MGTKTHIRLTNNHFLNALRSDLTHQHILSQFPEFDRDFYFKITNQLVLIKRDNPFNYNDPSIKQHLDKIRINNTVGFIDIDFQQQANLIIRPLATTGFLGILMALDLASDVSCYGFDFYDCPDNARHYYQESLQSRAQQAQSHTFSSEKKYFETLENPALTFYN